MYGLYQIVYHAQSRTSPKFIDLSTFSDFYTCVYKIIIVFWVRMCQTTHLLESGFTDYVYTYPIDANNLLIKHSIYSDV